MIFIENVKTIFETITAFTTAMIVINNLLKLMPKNVKEFFSKTIPLFFNGTMGANGKRVRFFDAIRIEKENQERLKIMISAVASDYETDEYLVLNKEELLNMLKSSKLFIHVSQRKH